jgi:hypothetical protein
VEKAPYLGVQLHGSLAWGSHVERVTGKANQMVGFPRRTLRYCPRKLKETAYITLVRSKLDYCSPIWDPHFEKDIKAVEAVQRRAARFVFHDYGRYSSVTSMLDELQWPTLAHRRRTARLTLLFKIVNSLVAVPLDDYLRSGSTRTRGANTQKFMNIGARTDTYKYAFFPRTVRDWNSLPFTPDATASAKAFRLRVDAVLRD